MIQFIQTNAISLFSAHPKPQDLTVCQSCSFFCFYFFYDLITSIHDIINMMDDLRTTSKPNPTLTQSGLPNPNDSVLKFWQNESGQIDDLHKFKI